MWFLNELFAFIFGSSYNNALDFLYLTRDGVNLGVSGFNMQGIINMSASITSIILPIADCLLVMYFLFNLIEMSSNETFTLQNFGKLLAKFVIFHILIINTFALMLSVLDLGTALIKDTSGIINAYGTTLTGSTVVESSFLGDVPIMDKAAGDYNTIKAVADACPKLTDKPIKTLFSGEFWTMVGYNLKYGFLLLAPFIISVICYGSIILAALSRILQFAIRIPLMPIAMSDMYNGGIHSRGMSTLKSMFALAFQGMIILIIIAIGNTLCSTMYNSVSNLFEAAIYISIVKLAQISLLGKSLDVSKEILGA